MHILALILIAIAPRSFAHDTLEPGPNITIIAPSDGFPTTGNAPAFYLELSLPPLSLTAVHIDFGPNTSAYPSFTLLQLHACFAVLSLSYNASLQPGLHQNGTNLGLIVRPAATRRHHTLFVHNANYHTAVEASIVLVAYDRLAPQPGACNLELEMTEVPVLQVHESAADVADNVVTVDTPLAADAAGRCEHSHPTRLQYAFYHQYLAAGDWTCSTYFAGIRSMLTAGDIERNGWPSVPLPEKPQRRTYGTMAGTGIVFATVVRLEVDVDSDATAAAAAAAYVPGYTIGCAPLSWSSGCAPFDTAAIRLLAGVLFIAGTVRAFLQPQLVFVGMAIDAFVVGVFAALLAEPYVWWWWWWPTQQTSSMVESLVWCCTCGAVVSAVLMATHSTCLARSAHSLRCTNEVMAHAVVGIVVAAFMADTIGSTADMQATAWWYQFVFGATLAAAVLLVPCCTRWGVVLMSAIGGAFGIVLALALVWPTVGWHAVYLMVNVMRSLRRPRYRTANSALPYGRADLALFGGWLAVCGGGLCAQLWLRGRAARRLRRAVDERTPIVTRWTDGSDDVFESPESNYRFFSRLRNEGGSGDGDGGGVIGAMRSLIRTDY